MFGIGLPELVIILVLALLVFGPKGLPEAGRTLGRWIHEFRGAFQDVSEEVRDSFNVEIPYEDARSHKPAEKKEEPGQGEGRPDARSPDAGD